ncbi:YbaN family protein [Pelotomaculum terephthalicicum JT]|uniref:YbaN family protein n=1 Tax=Pelotomaculum TaxID=191373 RepID=UPI0009CEF603|nr:MULTISPECIES: YbaN family protein [Pelotomaculum]MCG9969941.1 YbaN family protein [Pelotomaculum terephthalicicum JT]OPX91506.1 MAG: Inner membrane protein YbaN [Pelotomaculum sp. PtaB.Bin117]OPY63749.1 MAG: Inner membrane protein YbaN [Pelotomaculum sp. PtaU1.Bin065]
MKLAYVLLGFLFFGIGTVGAFLPILPTVPFLLVASFCFAKGSTRFNSWFRSTKLYKNHLDGLVSSRAMTLRSKITVLSLASVMLILAFVFSPSAHARILIVCLLALKYYYFAFKIKTVKENPVDGYQQKVS